MPTLPRFWLKRPRNDLDDYLAEVDDHLFCVSRADRQCLHRDLKAHARELTTDEAIRKRFKGRYGITEEQLNELLGVPSEISDMYIRSVIKTPSTGMRLFLLMAGIMSLWLVRCGIQTLEIGHRLAEGGDFDHWRGSAFIIAGLSGLALSTLNQFWYRSTYFTVPFLCLYMVIVARPVTTSLTNLTLKGIDITEHYALAQWIYPMYLIQILTVVALGLYLALIHFHAFMPEKRGLA